MLHLKLGERRNIDKSDPMARSWVGYDPDLPDETVFEQNRGVWILGPRANRETHAIFSFTGDHLVKFAVLVEDLERYARKRALLGHVLAHEDPIAQRWVGAPAPDRFRNPVSYVVETGGDATCACGCGEAIPPSRSFVPGHDQRAIHSRIERQWGDTLGFMRWFDAEYPDPSLRR